MADPQPLIALPGRWAKKQGSAPPAGTVKSNAALFTLSFITITEFSLLTISDFLSELLPTVLIFFLFY